ncbi:sigma-70 family RNA polymerase sigma factor [Hyunsoonleella flava]|uniref:RNA polymerase sigma factor n=1 Tax=Hyunsoonleella flava TaxID=2527939 RepID=A0A4Q9FL60_9FLAO|nr:sigma-70 family RNA polymerase sigma factor [Hyunsoonleella flava]TBN06377.1 sigma-70 family RNA polymerase sigma factor [Hyunsoonleella flava]
MSKELIQRAKKGNTDALNELIEKYKSVAFSIAFKYLKNKEDAEDITQNAFIIVLRSIKKFRNESKFSTWLYKIIYHECLKVLKSRNLMIEYIPEFTQIEAAEVKDETKKVDHKIDELLSHLKPNEYTVITLFYLKEKSIKEIGEITSFSKANIKVILHRARTKLKEIYNT